jgi:alpha-glucosidase
MLSHDQSPGHFRRCIETFQGKAPDGWASWSFSNHDVERHVSRWTNRCGDPAATAKQAIALLTSFPGGLGIYQGEELGQTQTDILFEELQDTANIAFWPEYKGRDGCRTPMVWEAEAPNAGFSTGTPWLPVKAPQAARAVDLQRGRNDSVLAHYRAALAFRKQRAELRQGETHFLDLPDPVLGIVRTAGGKSLTGLFNLSDSVQKVEIEGTPAGPQNAVVKGGTVTLPARGYVFLEG